MIAQVGKLDVTADLSCRHVQSHQGTQAAASDGHAAAAEFQKFIDHRGLVIDSWGTLARLGLAHAYTMQGDSAKAKAAYQEFLTLWKDADPSSLRKRNTQSCNKLAEGCNSQVAA